MALEKELETYRNKLPEWTAEEGKYVVIQGDEVGGTFESYSDALKFGYLKHGLEPFLVNQIRAVEAVQCFTRDLVLCLI